MTKRGGLCRPARGPLLKNAGRTDLFNPLTRISPPHNSPQPARASSGAGQAGPLTRKKKNWHLTAARQRFHKISKKETQHNRVNNVFLINVYV